MSPLSCSIRRSSSRNGISRRSASAAPKRRLAGPTKPDQRNPPMTSRRINSTELMEQQLVGKLEVLRGKTSEELDRMYQFHRWLRAFKQQNVNRDIQCLCQLPQHEDGNVSVAGFDLRQVTLRNAGIAGELFPGHAPSCSGLPDAIPERLQIGSGAAVLVCLPRLRRASDTRASAAPAFLMVSNSIR